MPRVTPCLLVPVLAAGLAAVPAAHAGAPRSVCRIVTDAEEDEGTFADLRPPTMVPDPTIDVVSADFASDGKYVTVVVRFTDLAQRTPDWRQDRFYFQVRNGDKNPQFFFEMTRDPSGDHPVFYHRAAKVSGPIDGSTLTTLAIPTYRYDYDKNELRMSVPAAALAKQAPIRRGGVVRYFQLRVYRSYSAGEVWEVSDAAESGKTYTVGTPSCVRPGK